MSNHFHVSRNKTTINKNKEFWELHNVLDKAINVLILLAFNCLDWNITDDLIEGKPSSKWHFERVWDKSSEFEFKFTPLI